MLDQAKAKLKLTEEELKKEVILRRQDDVFYLLLNRKANSFTTEFIRQIEQSLDEVEKSEGTVSLVTISLSKLFSGGLDLKYATNLPYKSQYFFILEYINLIGRLSVFPVPTIAIVKGPAVAGGCMFAFAHDFIIVEENAFFQTNEAQLGIPLPPGMTAVLKKRHRDYRSWRDMCLLGKKFSAQQALSYGLIDKIVPNKGAIQSAIELAKKMEDVACNRVNFKKIKSELYRDIIEACFCRQHGVGAIGQVKLPMLPKL